MFIGSINSDLRAILNEMAPNWIERPVFVGCSGNFTVERILAKAGVKEIHGNDVSLYSCALGWYLTGLNTGVNIKVPEYNWLAKYMTNGIGVIATLMLCSEMFKYVDRPEPFHRRMFQAYKVRFDGMHSETAKKVVKALEGVRLESFYSGDVINFMLDAPEDCVAISFPPTYSKGYERMYKKIDEVFEWERPDYVIFDDQRFELFTTILTSKKTWVTLRDKPVERFKDNLKGIVQTGLRSKPVYIYAGEGKTRLTQARQKTEPVNIKRLEGEITGPLSLVRLTVGQMNTLRSEYLATGIVPAAPQISLGVVAGDRLIGAMGFPAAKYGDMNDVYMMSDFAVPQKIYKRLSKLVLIAAASKEVQAILQQAFNRKVKDIYTTAFTDKAVSMKYRGIFEVYNRKEGFINYVSEAGRWTLAEGLETWKKKHSQKLTG